MTDIIKKTRSEGETPSVPASTGKIIDREVIMASDEARRIIEAARAQATQIQASVQAVRDQAVKDGHQEGYERGLGEWLKETQRVHEGLKGFVDQARPQLVRLALRVAEKILRQKLEMSPETVVPMIDEALRSVRAQQQARIIIRVNPADQPMLESRRQRWLERFPSIASLDIVADDTLQRGGCRLETDFGSVDATIETQIRVIERHLLGDAGGSGNL